MARRGGRAVAPSEGTASGAWRRAVADARRGAAAEREPWEPERFERVDEPAPRRGRASAPAAAAEAPARPRRKAPEAVARELADVVGPKRAPKMEQRLMDAARAYDRERFQDARRILKPLAEEAPAAAAVRELHGLALYRAGRWADAARELEAYRLLTGSVDQHPVLADCYRALRRWNAVEDLWRELREASPSAELVAEGRIVAAGALADQGRVQDAIRLLEQARLTSRHPREHHLRLWYALADLYERAGDLPRARDLFRRIVAHDREFADAVERVSALG